MRFISSFVILFFCILFVGCSHQVLITKNEKLLEDLTPDELLREDKTSLKVKIINFDSLSANVYVNKSNLIKYPPYIKPKTNEYYFKVNPTANLIFNNSEKKSIQSAVPYNFKSKDVERISYVEVEQISQPLPIMYYSKCLSFCAGLFYSTCLYSKILDRDHYIIKDWHYAAAALPTLAPLGVCLYECVKHPNKKKIAPIYLSLVVVNAGLMVWDYGYNNEHSLNLWSKIKRVPPPPPTPEFDPPPDWPQMKRRLTPFINFSFFF